MKHKHWYWQNGIDPRICDEWIHRYDSSTYQGIVDGTMELSGVRRSDVHMTRDKDVSDILIDMCNEANNMAFGLNTNNEITCQYTTYKGDVKGFYDWHMDLHIGGDMATDRKVSIIVMLSDPREFEGGDLLIERDVIELQKGSVIAFPSFLSHKVTEVTKGVRRTMVGWQRGAPFI